MTNSNNTSEFSVLTSELEAQWHLQKNNFDSFPALAAKCLENFEYQMSKEQLDQWLSNWLLNLNRLPEQINVHNTFGQPPITLFNNGLFVLDLYIWLNFDTSIHSHGFRGAFKVLHGSSLHETFSVQPITTFSDDIMLVDLKRAVREILKQDDVRIIEPEKLLTHRVIHLENPTITLCARTVNETSIKQWHYFSNGLAIQKKLLSADLVKKIYFAQYLLGQSKTRAKSFLTSLLDGLEVSVQMNMYEDLWRGSLELSDEALQFFVDAIIERHGSTPWFQKYEEANPELLGLLDASEFNEPGFRLLGHFVNSDEKFADGLPLLEKSFGRKILPQELDQMLQEFRIESKAQLARVQKFLKV